ncbi:S-adenosyl-L-methionine-dependent methyltransferase [Hypoxylon argillaceum]|nr:S-adenosyl-L-methionine-dependent methyltransferase [Hypoxylon argillaceum]
MNDGYCVRTNDTAAGPGIGAAALVARLPAAQLPREVLVSDKVATMVSAAHESLAASPLPRVECKELDSEDLSSAVSDDYFTHSLNNFSIFTFRKIRPDLPLMPAPGLEFNEEGVLQRVVEEGGFAKDNITVLEKTLVVADDENKAGLTTLMSGPMMIKAREGYTEAEEAVWVEAVNQSVKEEVEQFGGIRFEAYILLATK